MQRLVGRIGDEFRRRQVAFAHGQHDQARLAEAAVPDVDDLGILELDDLLADGQVHAEAAPRPRVAAHQHQDVAEQYQSHARARQRRPAIVLEPGGDAERHDGKQHGRIGRPVGADALDQGEEGSRSR